MSLPSAVCLGRWRSADRFAALRERQYHRFWYAALAHDIGGWLLFAAQGWLLILLAASPQIVTLFFVLRLTPRALLGLPAGAVSDRYGALRVLRIARLAAALPALGITAAAATGRLSADVVLIAAVLSSVIQAFDQPGHRTMLHRYAPGGLLVGGVALSAMAGTIATLTGPLLLALAAALPGLIWAFPLQAALTIVSGIILLGNRDPHTAEAHPAEAVGRDCWLAIRYLASAPAIVALSLLAGSPAVLDRLLTLATPGYAAGQGGAAGMTLLFLAPATGALLGGSLLAWIGGEVRRLLPLALGSSSVAVVSVGLLATTRLFLLSLLLFLVLGAAKAAFSIAVMSALQRRVPDHARGRLLAL